MANYYKSRLQYNFKEIKLVNFTLTPVEDSISFDIKDINILSQFFWNGRAVEIRLP